MVHRVLTTDASARWRRIVLITLGYGAIGLLWTWPLPRFWRSGVIQFGALPIDGGQNLWNLWWTHAALRQGLNPYRSRYLLYPDTVDLFRQTLGLPNAVLVWPVLDIFGPVAAFNVAIWLSFALGGLWVYLLARRVGLTLLPALLAGVIFILSPPHFQPLLSGSLEVATIHWIALYLLTLQLVLERPRPLRVIIAAAALLIATLVSHYYGLFSAVYTVGAVGLAAMLAASRRLAWQRIGAGLAIGLVWVGTLLPLLGSPATLEATALRDWEVRQLYHSIEPVNLIVPNVLHPLWGDWAQRLMHRLDSFGPEAAAPVSVTLYVLLGFGAWGAWRASWPWLALGLGTAILAFGPELLLGGVASGIPLPMRLLDLTATFRTASRPSRMLAVSMVPLALAAAWGLQALRARWPTRRTQLTALFTLGLMVELAVRPWPILIPQVDPAYRALVADATPGAVLELPPRNDDSSYMLNQLCHGRPLVGGYLAHTPPHSLLEHPSVVRQLWAAQPPDQDIFGWTTAAELATLGIRTIILHPNDLDPASLNALRTSLAQPGITRAQDTTAIERYTVEPAAARAIVLPGRGWFDLESGTEDRWRWIGATASAELRVPYAADVQLHLRGFAYQTSRPLRVILNDQLLLTTAVASGQTTGFVLRLALPPGTHRLELRSEAAPDDSGRLISIAFTEFSVTGSRLPGPMPALAPPTLPPATGAPCS